MPSKLEVRESEESGKIYIRSGVIESGRDRRIRYLFKEIMGGNHKREGHKNEGDN